MVINGDDDYPPVNVYIDVALTHIYKSTISLNYGFSTSM